MTNDRIAEADRGLQSEGTQAVRRLSNMKTSMPKLKCEHHAQASRDYLACFHVMNGDPISLFEEATERTPSKDGEAGVMVCAVCAELGEEALVANTTLICGNCADRLMADQDFVA